MGLSAAERRFICLLNKFHFSFNTALTSLSRYAGED